MNPRWMVAAVIVLVILVGGAFLLIGVLRGDDTDLERQPVQGSASTIVPAPTPAGGPAAARGVS